MIKFAKVRDVKSPARGTEKSAGIDFFVPSMDEKFCDDLFNANKKRINKEYVFVHKTIILNPQEKIVIPSGIKVNFDNIVTMALVAHNKSGVGANKGLSFLAHVVDQDYQGEIFISLVNNSNKPQYIEQGDKIIQFLLMPVFFPELEEVSEKELYPETSQRGNGALGSTGSK